MVWWPGQIAHLPVYFGSNWKAAQWAVVITAAGVVFAAIGIVLVERRARRQDLERERARLDERIDDAVRRALPDVQQQLLLAVGKISNETKEALARATEAIARAHLAAENAETATRRFQDARQQAEDRMRLIFEDHWIERAQAACRGSARRKKEELPVLCQELFQEFKYDLASAVFDLPHQLAAISGMHLPPFSTDQRRNLGRRCRDSVMARVCDLAEGQRQRSLQERVRLIYIETVRYFIEEI